MSTLLLKLHFQKKQFKIFQKKQFKINFFSLNIIQIQSLYHTVLNFNQVSNWSVIRSLKQTAKSRADL